MKKSKLKYQLKKTGFSLIELIIYMALVSIFISSAVLFAWDIIYGKAKSQVQVEVNQNARLIMERIGFELKQANGIVSLGGSSITISNPDPLRNPVVFDVNNGQVRVGVGLTGSCSSISPCNLSSNQVSISNLLFEDLSAGANTSIRFSVTVDSIADRQEWQSSKTLRSAVTLRAKP